MILAFTLATLNELEDLAADLKGAYLHAQKELRKFLVDIQNFVSVC